MRVLTFLHSFEPGGVERVALRLIRQWRLRGVDAPLFMGREEGALQAELAQDLAFTVPPSPISTGWFETLWMIWTLPAAIRKIQPDVLFCAGNTYTIVAVAMKLLLGRRCPPIVAKASNDLVRPGLPPGVRQLHIAWAWLQSRFIDGWVVMHASMDADVRRFSGDAGISVIPDPALVADQIARLRQWRAPPPSRRGRRFVAIGRLVAQKNYPLMIRAFAASGPRFDTLTIFGDGPRRKRLERLVERLGVGERIRFAGHVHDASARLADHDALLLSSSYEGIPAVLVEAMTCGMPIAATDCGPGVTGLLEDYPDATVTRSGDVDAMVASIWKLSAARPRSAPANFDADPFTIEAGADAYVAAFAATIRAAPRPEKTTATSFVPFAEPVSAGPANHLAGDPDNPLSLPEIAAFARD